MRKLYQTDTTDKTGNCLQYAVASILQLEASEVPPFSPTNYLREYTRVCNQHGIYLLHGFRPNYHLVHAFLQQTTELIAPAYCILGVKSFKHKRVHHAVVGLLPKEGYRFTKVVHDPNPENKDRKGNEYQIVDYDFLIPTTDHAEHLICELAATERI